MILCIELHYFFSSSSCELRSTLVFVSQVLFSYCLLAILTFKELVVLETELISMVSLDVIDEVLSKSSIVTILAFAFIVVDVGLCKELINVLFVEKALVHFLFIIKLIKKMEKEQQVFKPKNKLIIGAQKN